MVHTFLPPSIATIKGHMSRTRKNVRSTQPKDETSDFNPKREEKLQQIFVKKVELATYSGTVYTNATGRFPHPSSSDMNYILVMYDYASNVILAEPLKNRSDTEYLHAYEKLYDYLHRSERIKTYVQHHGK